MTEHAGAADRPLRSRTDKVIAGVAGGLGRYLGVQPLILRIAFVVLAVTGGPGILLYILGWIFIPMEPSGTPPAPKPQLHTPSGRALRVLAGGLLIAIGVIWLMSKIVPWFGELAWPAALIAVGTAIVV